MIFRHIVYFLRLIDDNNRLDLTAIAFMVILVKIISAANVDWPSVITLALACINYMHQRQNKTKLIEDVPLTEAVKDQSKQLADIQSKISPILEMIKGKLS